MCGLLLKPHCTCCYCLVYVVPLQVPLSRFDVPRAGLSLLTKHAAHFSEFLTKDYQDVYHCLFTWCNHSNREMKNLGFLALESFFQQVRENASGIPLCYLNLSSVSLRFQTSWSRILSMRSTGRQFSLCVRHAYGGNLIA